MFVEKKIVSDCQLSGQIFRLQFVYNILYNSECKKLVSKHELYINSTLNTTCRPIFKSNIVNSVAEQIILKLRQWDDRKNKLHVVWCFDL